jgi:hypothetical protein
MVLELLYRWPEAQRFPGAFADFLQRHGYRCPNAAGLHNPRRAEQPEQVIELLKQYVRLDERANPLALELQRREERAATTARLRSQIYSLRRPLFTWLLKHAQQTIRMRDNNRSVLAKFLFSMRPVLVECGWRRTERGWFTYPDKIFFLTLSMMGDVMSAQEPFVQGRDLSITTAARRVAFAYWQTVSAPPALVPGGVPLPDPSPMGMYACRLPASPGMSWQYVCQAFDCACVLTTDVWTPAGGNMLHFSHMQTREMALAKRSVCGAQERWTFGCRKEVLQRLASFLPTFMLMRSFHRSSAVCPGTFPDLRERR